MKRETLIFLIYFAFSFFIFLACMSVWIAPYFSIAILVIFLSVLIFILTERWATHDASEFENRFWSLIAFLVSSVFLFVEDSPFSFARKAPEVAFFIILLFTYIVHNYDRHLRRLVLNRIPEIKRTQSIRNKGSPIDVNAQVKLVEIEELVSKIDPVWCSSVFLNRFYIMKIECDIINIFSDVSAYDLNCIIKKAPLGLIFYKIKDHRFFNGFHRTKLIDLLAVERILELNVSSRALLLYGLQQMKLSAHIKSEEWAKNIILKTCQDELSELKSLMDSKGDFNNMHKLVYVDIRTPKIKQEILDHIFHEARIQKAHMSLNTRLAKRRQQFAWRKILADVDDTLSCSGGHFPAGVDDSFPRKTIYPGVLALFRELDLGNVKTENEYWNSDNRTGNLVFLSARPHVYKDLSEKQSFEKFRKLVETNRLHTTPSLLAGSLDTGGQFLVEGSLEPLAKKKFENFIEYLALYPEFQCIFIGDNGQGDVRATEMLVERKQYESNLLRTYIHEVQPLHLTFTKNTITKSKLCHRICYFKTYVDAGLDALQHGLISPFGLRRLTQEAIRDFDEIPEVAWMNGEAKGGIWGREARRFELRQAVQRANEELIKRGLLKVKLPPMPCLYPVGTAVITPFGKGVVNRFRKNDGIYEIELIFNGPNKTPPIRAYFNSQILTPVISKINKIQQTDRLAPTIISIVNNINFKGKSHIDKDKSCYVNISSVIGALVWTPYGKAKITRLRYVEKFPEVEVRLIWGGIGYLQPSCVIVLLSHTISTTLLLSPKTTPISKMVHDDYKKREISVQPKTPSFHLRNSVLTNDNTYEHNSNINHEAKYPSNIDSDVKSDLKSMTRHPTKLWPWSWTSSPITQHSQPQSHLLGDCNSINSFQNEIPLPFTLSSNTNIPTSNTTPTQFYGTH